MNLPFFIARKYFLSKKKKNFINVISLISMIVVAVGTMSLIVALSVFNGLEGLLKSLYGNFDPDIVITPATGKSFEWTPQLEKKLATTDGVLKVTEVIEDNVLLQYKGAQRLVKMKGVSSTFAEQSNIEDAIVAGDAELIKDSIAYALVGRGVQYDLAISLQNDFYALQVFYPKNIAPGVINPERMYTLRNILPGGIFAIEKFYDENYIFVPIEFAQDLLSYGNRRTSLEVKIASSNIKENLQETLGNEFLVRSGDELHSDLFKTLKIEKLFVFVTFISIIGIASVNIFFVLTMLAIEKRRDITVLIANGAPTKLIRQIFLYEGCIVALSGAFVGIILGLAISLIQEKFGLIGMGMETAVMQSYPVKVEALDIVITAIAIITITVLASIQPARKASKSFSIQALQ